MSQDFVNYYRGAEDNDVINTTVADELQYYQPTSYFLLFQPTASTHIAIHAQIQAQVPASSV